jgi:glycosyltransferase involved in cell wall biosynthesis
MIVASRDAAPDRSTGTVDTELVRAAAAVQGRPVVLQVLPSLVAGGSERSALDVAAALMAAGGTALVISGGGPMTAELKRVGAVHIRLPVDTKNPLVMGRNIGRLQRLIVEHGVDIVHARSRAPAWSAWFAARRTHRRFVTTFHGTYNISGPIKRWYNAIMTRGDRVIANSRFIADHIVANYGVDPSTIRVIPRGIDLRRFDPARVSAERVTRLAREWRLSDGVPVVLLPGRLSRWKGHLVLIDALAALGRTDICCVIVGAEQGRTGYRRELEARVRERGLDAVVRLAEHCDDMPAAYWLADVVVSASTDPEAFGRIVVEAQAMGRPVVATRHGGAGETVRDGETGWLVPPADVAALAQALARALALDGPARDAMARRAIEHARANFGRDEMCARTLAVYRELMTLGGR